MNTMMFATLDPVNLITLGASALNQGALAAVDGLNQVLGTRSEMLSVASSVGGATASTLTNAVAPLATGAINLANQASKSLGQ